MRLDWAAASDTGLVRANNQDSAVAEDGLFAVADGMGGHAAGEVASRIAVEELRAAVGRAGLVEAVRLANRAVIDRAATDPALRGMGTTLVAIALEGDQVVIVNVGDSRGYLFRDGELQQITEDHNLVAQLEREGRLTPEEARVHPQRNIITRVLGNDPDVEIDVFRVDAFRGDRFLLCSDGLFNEVEDDVVADVLRNHRDPHAVADELVRRANARGGRDNITVVVVDVLDDDDKARAASAALAGAAATTVAEPIANAAPAVPPRRVRRADDGIALAPPRPRRVTWRSVLFSLAVLVVAGAMAGSVWWFGRNTFYVGVAGDQVTIFRGRPGGVLWLEPTVEQRTDLSLAEVPRARRDDVKHGKDQADLPAARRYVTNLRRQAAEEQASTATTTSTTTSTAVPFGAPAITATSTP